MSMAADIWELPGPDGAPYKPTAKQSILHSVNTTQILYGGAAGGAKSTALRYDQLTFCLQNKNLFCVLFRRTYPELEANHITPMKMLGIPSKVAVYAEARKQLEFANGSIIRMGYAENENDITRFQGQEIHYLGVDEAGLCTPYQILYLRGRVRLGSYKPTQAAYFPRVVFTSNPGGPGHAWLKRTFISPSPPMTVFHDKSTASKINPLGWSSIFIPSRMSDNPHLDEGSYSGAFTGMSPEMARALRDGDWDAVVGAAFSNLSRNRNMVREFRPPRYWTHFMAIDWGTARPFSVGWYAISEGALLKGKDGWPDKWLPPGALIRFAEYYGWNGKENEGVRLESNRVALEVLRREADMDLPPMDFRVGDPQMWAQVDGPSPQQRMKESTGGRFMLRQGRRDRKANYTEALYRFGGEDVLTPSGAIENTPLFFATENCFHFWRTVPTLHLDSTDPEKGPDTRGQEDHCFIAGTPVMTRRGWRPIEEIGQADLVLTTKGFKVPVQLGCTGIDQKVWKVRTEHGEFTATGGHPILTPAGYVQVCDLCVGDEVIRAAWVPHNTLTDWPITNAGRTGSEKDDDFIATCGRITTGLFQRAIISITRMATAATTTFPIWNVCYSANTSVSMPQHQNERPKSGSIWSRTCGRKLRNGIDRLRDVLGIRSRERKLDSLATASSVSAEFVERLSRPVSEALRFVPPSVPPKLSVSHILAITDSGVADVWNLHVPGPNNFVVAGGTVVHNCYDEVSFASSQFSRVTTAQDRMDQDLIEMERIFKTHMDDPYATARRGLR